MNYIFVLAKEEYVSKMPTLGSDLLMHFHFPFNIQIIE